jgi:hypothetical protein
MSETSEDLRDKQDDDQRGGDHDPTRSLGRSAHGTPRRELTGVMKGGGECTLLALPAAAAG